MVAELAASQELFAPAILETLQKLTALVGDIVVETPHALSILLGGASLSDMKLGLAKNSKLYECSTWDLRQGPANA